VNLFYSAPEWITLSVFTVGFVGVSLLLIIVVRSVTRRVVTDSTQWDRVLGYTSSSFSAFFGILLALVAVSVYANYVDAHQSSAQEVSRISALYRTADGLPEPLRDEMRGALTDYVHTVIDDDWPAQRQDKVPDASSAGLDEVEQVLDAFDPTTLQAHARYTQMLATFDEFVEARSARIDATTLHLPDMFWFVIWIGAIINALLIAMIDAKSRGMHLVMGGLLAVFVAMVMFVTAEMDHPYAGWIAVGPGDFERLLDTFGRP
jgi:hypothetical protein